MRNLKNRRLGKLISILLMVAMMFSAGQVFAAEGDAGASSAVQLSDLGGSYAANEIRALVGAGIISGFEDGSFRPHEAMTRAQMAKVLVLSLGLKEDAAAADRFADVGADAWYKGYVGALMKSGITDGTSDSTFSPDAQVSREQLAVFFIRAFGLQEQAYAFAGEVQLSDFAQVASWAKSSVALAFRMGFINGIDNGDGTVRFAPGQYAERQALARLAYEFKFNQKLYLDKAAELAKDDEPVDPEQPPATGGGGGGGGGGSSTPAFAVSSVIANTNTQVTVTFNRNVTAPNAAEFVFTPALDVESAEFGSSNRVVVLETGHQLLDVNYTLTYQGRASRSFTGSNKLTKLAAGNYEGTYYVGEGVPVIGPETDTAIIEGTLQLDPGPDGEIQVRNINATNIEVLSGDSNSVELGDTSADKLIIKAGGQDNPVHVVSQSGTDIGATDVSSKVLLDSEAGNLGDVTITEEAAGESIQLSGTFSGAVNVKAAGATLSIPAGTTVPTLKLSAGATINADGNVGALEVDDPGIQITLTGSARDTIISATLSAANNEIAALPDAENVQLSDRTDVKKARGKVNAILVLDPDGTIDDINKLEAVEAKIKELALADALDKLDQIPEASSITLEQLADVKPKVKAAKEAVQIAREEGFGDADLTGVEKIAAAEARIAVLETGVTADLETARTALVIAFASGDSASRVTQNLTLPTSGASSTTVTWSSGNVNVIKNNGEVARPPHGSKNVAVKLTATITKFGVSVTKTFVVTVIPVELAAAKLKTVKAVIGSSELQATVINGTTVNLVIPASYSGSDMFTRLILEADSHATTLIVTVGNESRPVTFVNGAVDASVAEILGDLDGGGDGVSVGHIRNLVGTETFTPDSSTLFDNQGQSTEITINLSVEPVLRVLNASALIGEDDYPATVLTNGDVHFEIPAALNNKAMATEITIETTDDVIELEVNQGTLGQTFQVEDGQITLSIAEIVGPGLDPDQDGLSVGVLRGTIGTETMILTGKLHGDNDKYDEIKIHIQAAEADPAPLIIQRADGFFGADDVYSAQISGNRISFTVPEGLEDSARFTQFAIISTYGASYLSVTENGITKQVAFENGLAVLSVSELLGEHDPQGDGVSVGFIRTLIGTGKEITGTIHGTGNRTADIIIALSQE